MEFNSILKIVFATMLVFINILYFFKYATYFKAKHFQAFITALLNGTKCRQIFYRIRKPSYFGDKENFVICLFH
jgi:hypothetical protein